MQSLLRRAAAAAACAALVQCAHGFGGTASLLAPVPRGRCVHVPSLRASIVAPVRTGGEGDEGRRDDAVQRPWPPKSSRVKGYSLIEGEVPVRFINAPGRYPSGLPHLIVPSFAR